MGPRRNGGRVRAAVLTLCAVALTGCGTSDVVATDGQPPASPYDGPMSLPADPGDEERPVLERSGAAGLALECDGRPYNGGAADYVEGDLYDLGGDAADGLDSYLDAEGWAYTLPTTGYRLEREDQGRALFSYDVGLRTKIAFILAEDMRSAEGDRGWGVESWAQCDPAELPARVTDALGIGVWTDASGDRVPTTRIRSFQGAEHCGWEDITFLALDGGRREQYVRDVGDELGRDLLTSAFDPRATLPDSLTDTGLRRDGRQLWLDEQRRAAYLVSVDDPNDVERWPAAREPVLCA